jgi:uncharacterized protein YneF (UPF0154 family)
MEYIELILITAFTFVTGIIMGYFLNREPAIKKEIHHGKP